MYNNAKIHFPKIMALFSGTTLDVLSHKSINFKRKMDYYERFRKIFSFSSIWDQPQHSRFFRLEVMMDQS